MKKPKYLYRPDDGFRFTLQSDGKYTMDKSMMANKYRYEYKVLISLGFDTFERNPLNWNSFPIDID